MVPKPTGAAEDTCGCEHGTWVSPTPSKAQDGAEPFPTVCGALRENGEGGSTGGTHGTATICVNCCKGTNDGAGQVQAFKQRIHQQLYLEHEKKSIKTTRVEFSEVHRYSSFQNSLFKTSNSLVLLFHCHVRQLGVHLKRKTQLPDKAQNMGIFAWGYISICLG